MKPSTPRQRLLRVSLVGGGLLLLLLGYGAFYNHTGHGIPCIIYRLTGMKCAGCGLTRAIAAVMRLDFSAAFAYNPIWLLYAVYFLWIGSGCAVTYLRTGETDSLPGKLWVHILFLSAVLLFGVLRNVRGTPV